HSRLTVGKPPGTLRWTERGQGQLEIDVRRELERLRDPDLGGAAVDLTREPLEIDARRHEVRLPAEELPGLADGEVDDRRLQLEVEVADPEGWVVEEGRLTHRGLIAEEVHFRDGGGPERSQVRRADFQTQPRVPDAERRLVMRRGIGPAAREG